MQASVLSAVNVAAATADKAAAVSSSRNMVPPKNNETCEMADPASSQERSSKPRQGDYWENVSQAATWPLLRPVVSHFARMVDEPWVKLSGTA